MSKAETGKAVDFEAALKSLEEVVETMESKQLSLDESLAQFEKGIGLSKDCAKALDEAELKVKTIMQSMQKDDEL